MFVDCQKLSLPLKIMHEEVCNTLQAAVLGDLPEYKFIVVNIMPRVGKTKLIEALHCWTHAYFPNAQIITTSYSAELAERSVRYVEGVLASPWYLTAFGQRLGDIQRSDQYTTLDGGTMYCAGVGGTILGFGAGLKEPAGGYIAVDDPSNPKEVLSKDVMEKLKLWFEGTLMSRRNSDEHTPIIVIAQRLSVDDLPGYILQTYPEITLHLKYPAMVNGVSQFPETLSTEALIRMRDSSGLAAYAYAGMYEQEPVVLGGNLIKTDDFGYHSFDPLGQSVRWEVKVISADTAMKAKQSADNSVLQCWGRLKGQFYLLDMIYGKWDSPTLIQQSMQFYNKHHRPSQAGAVNQFLIEDMGSGVTLTQELPKRGVPVKPVTVTKDKVTRVHEILPKISSHMVHIPAKAPWVEAFKSECAAFRADGKNHHDDMVDAMSQALSYIGGGGVTIYDVLRREQDAVKQRIPGLPFKARM